MLAAALLDAGLADQAVDEYRACLRGRPADRDVLLGLASAYRAAGKPDAALVALDDLLARVGDDAQAGILRARILHETGRPAEAIDAYRAAREADPRVEDLEFAAALGAEATGADEATEAEADEDDEEDEPRRERIRIGGEEPGESDYATELERPRIDFSHVGGMEGVKDEIRLKIIHPLAHPELYAAYGKASGGGILLYGPPGCGKTYLARATAGEVRANFLSIGIEDVLDMWLGQSERNLHGVFETARSHRPTVLFFDEVDALGGTRREQRASAGRTVVNQFLAELDGVDASNEGVLVLAATNAPWHLDAAFRRPGRFDRVVFVPPPDREARAEILKVMLADKPAAGVDHDDLAKRTDGFSGADLLGLVDRAVEVKLAQAIRDGIPTPLTTKDLVEALKGTVPTTREWFATARNYVLYANEGGLYDAVRPYLRL